MTIFFQLISKIMTTKVFTDWFEDEGRALLGRSITPESVEYVFNFLQKAQEKYA